MPATAEATIITFTCGNCGRPFAVPASYAGRKATCKTCGGRVVVPATSAGSADADDAAVFPAAATNGKPHPQTVESHGGAAAADALGDELAIPTSDPEQPARQHSHIAIISEAQSSPVTAALAPALGKAGHAAGRASPEVTERPQAPGQAPNKVPVRIRRLMVDAEQMQAAFAAGDGPIHIKSAVGDPPELYQVEYKVTGLQRGWLGRPKKRTSHLVEIQLTSEYPRVSPKCRMLTPVFHPNIDPTTICVGDHWTAGERLVDLTVRIGEMLAYQAYNIKSPLDGEAAMWADLNTAKLPTDGRNFHPAGTE